MTEGTSQGLFIVVAIVIFGIFVSLSYTLFGKTLQPQMVQLFESSFETESPNYKKQKYYGVNEIEISPETDFTFTDGTIIDYIGSEKEVVIPYEIKGKLVTRIGNMAFNHKGLTKVIIPATVKVLEDGKHWSHSDKTGSFKGNNLTKINLPDSITHIGIGSFADNQLVDIKFPRNLKEIELDAFRNNKLVSLNLPNGLLKIGQDAFEMNKLKSLTLPVSVKELGYCSFNINEIENVNLNEGLDTIGSHAFSTNIGLKTIKIPSTVTKIDSYAFLGTTITEVEVPINAVLDAKAFTDKVTVTRK